MTYRVWVSYEELRHPSSPQRRRSTVGRRWGLPAHHWQRDGCCSILNSNGQSPHSARDGGTGLTAQLEWLMQWVRKNSPANGVGRVHSHVARSTVQFVHSMILPDWFATQGLARRPSETLAAPPRWQRVCPSSPPGRGSCAADNAGGSPAGAQGMSSRPYTIHERITSLCCTYNILFTVVDHRPHWVDIGYSNVMPTILCTDGILYVCTCSVSNTVSMTLVHHHSPCAPSPPIVNTAHDSCILYLQHCVGCMHGCHANLHNVLQWPDVFPLCAENLFDHLGPHLLWRQLARSILLLVATDGSLPALSTAVQLHKREDGAPSHTSYCIYRREANGVCDLATAFTHDNSSKEFAYFCPIARKCSYSWYHQWSSLMILLH